MNDTKRPVHRAAETLGRRSGRFNTIATTDKGSLKPSRTTPPSIFCEPYSGPWKIHEVISSDTTNTSPSRP